MVMDLEGKAARRVKLATELNRAEADLEIAKQRLAIAKKDADMLVEYEASKKEAIAEAREKARLAPLAQRLEAVEAFNKIEADAIRNDADAHRIRCELGTATVEYEKAEHAHDLACKFFVGSLSTPSEENMQTLARNQLPAQ